MSESSLWGFGDELSDEDEYSEEEEVDGEMRTTRTELNQSSDSGQDLPSGGVHSPSTVNISEIENSVQTFWESVNARMENLDAYDFRTCELPLARIKKIMKLDENVRMISAEVPILLSKAADLFIQDLTMRSWANTTSGKRRTLQQSDICAAASQNEQFDFLIDILPRDEMFLPPCTPTKQESQTKISPSSQGDYTDGSEGNNPSSYDTNGSEEEGEEEYYEGDQYDDSDMSACYSLTSDDSMNREAKEEEEGWQSSNGVDNYCQSQGNFYNGIDPMAVGNCHMTSSPSRSQTYNGQQMTFQSQPNQNANIYYNNIALPTTNNAPAFYIMNTTPDGRIVLSNPNTVGDPLHTPILQLTQEQLEQIASIATSSVPATGQTVQQNSPYVIVPATFKQNGLENGVTR